MTLITCWRWLHSRFASVATTTNVASVPSSTEFKLNHSMHRKWNSNSNTNSSPFSLLEIFPSFCVCVWFESFAATARTTAAEMQRCIGAYDIGIVKSAHVTDDTLACESEINDGMSMSARTHSLLLYFVPKIKRCVCVRPAPAKQTYGQTYTCDKFHEKPHRIVEERSEHLKCIRLTTPSPSRRRRRNMNFSMEII